jgi:hypothetical protein
MDTILALRTRAHIARRESFYNDSSANDSGEDTMGTTLYNKIHLGRPPLLASRRMQAALMLGALAGVALVWAALHAMK